MVRLTVLIFSSLVFCACGSGKKNLAALPENIRLVEEVKKEPKVIEAIVTDANVLYVSVKDDGTRRDGYASYFCQLIVDAGSKIDNVKVVEAGTAGEKNGYGILLGESACK